MLGSIGVGNRPGQRFAALAVDPLNAHALSVKPLAALSSQKLGTLCEARQFGRAPSTLNRWDVAHAGPCRVRPTGAYGPARDAQQ
ncbi:hypothetical protein CHELA40_12629 [Chelatococcus asaccharovorans]|nr:hypothetical protein CHELA40_12629 [Chelatococcus asaccharovorans]CAH1682116.1 hypothetical protein CHELA17_62987 [Chelatococcus asaccharovorans]